MLTYVNLSADNYLEFDVCTETLLRVRLDGDITTTTDEKKIEYTTDSGLRIVVNLTPLEWTLEVNSYTINFKASYCDFQDMPEILAGLIASYIERK